MLKFSIFYISNYNIKWLIYKILILLLILILDFARRKTKKIYKKVNIAKRELDSFDICCMPDFILFIDAKNRQVTQHKFKSRMVRTSGYLLMLSNIVSLKRLHKYILYKVLIVAKDSCLGVEQIFGLVVWLICFITFKIMK